MLLILDTQVGNLFKRFMAPKVLSLLSDTLIKTLLQWNGTVPVFSGASTLLLSIQSPIGWVGVILIHVKKDSILPH